MIHTTIKRSGRPLIPYLTLCVFLVFILSCSDGGGGSDGTGSIALALKFQEVGDARLGELQFAQREEFCNDRNLDRIEAEVYDENGIEIASGSWPCYVGEGEITGVRAGPNRKVEVFGRDPSGSITYEGETEEPINVVAGGMAYAEIEIKSLYWYKTLGTTKGDYGFGIGIDSDRNCYITGYTEGTLDNLDNIKNQGGEDIFISKYDKCGDLKWTQLLGSPGDDHPWGGIAVDSNGNCYISG